MIVVSDTSPLTALLTVGEAELLVRLFGEVWIPEAISADGGMLNSLGLVV